MRGGRRLSSEEAEAWARLARGVTPLTGRRLPAGAATPVEAEPAPMPAPIPPKSPPPKGKPRGLPGFKPEATPQPRAPDSRRLDSRRLDSGGLDGGWERRLAKGAVAPDFTLDLHGATLDAAYARLEHGLALAAAQGARVVLLIAGRSRPAPDPADRASHRGAIRAKLLDWLAHGPHASRIAAVRGAHPRHGGAGAVYIVLRRGR